MIGLVIAVSYLIGQARAHSNIALIKYWGKIDSELHIPQNNSLSLTQDAFYTDTKVLFSDDLTKDEFYLNYQKQDAKEVVKISKFINIFRNLAGINLPCRVESHNNMPSAAGFGSSASAYAALTKALDDSLKLNLDSKNLSILARRGSGSACRSIYPGLVEWQQGDSNETSYAVPFDPADFPICTVTMALSGDRKKFSSRKGMEISVNTSPYYSAWKEYSKKFLEEIKIAIKEKDINKIGEIAEQNALAMHSLTITAQPSFFYFSEETLRAISSVHKLRKQGHSLHFTIDAGPNIVIICNLAEADKIQELLKLEFPTKNLILSKPGPGVRSLESWEY